MSNIVNRTPNAPITRSKVWDDAPKSNADLKSGVSISFPILAVGTNQWVVRWKGEDRLVKIPGTDYPAPFVDVVILNAQKDMSRMFYRDAYQQGSRGKQPDCWSSNGIRPDESVADPVNPVCATCPNARWGSGGSPAAPKAQACQQRRRTVVVPYSDAQGFDLTNEAEGGPMLLSVPPGSLQNQVKYGEALDDLEMGDGTKGIFYAAVVTRLSYEPLLKYSKIQFDFQKALNDEESMIVKALRDSEQTKRILNSKIDAGGEAGATDAPSPVVQVVPPKAAAPVTPRVTPPPAPPKETKAPPPPPPKVGGHPVGINEALARPAEPPQSKRTVATAPPDDDDAEAKAPMPGGEMDVFDDLMSRD